jgi:hypothetical protein
VINSLIKLSLSGFLSRFQSGFRRFYSTANTLTSIVDDIHLSVGKSGFSIALLLDSSKVFVCMVHGLLLQHVKVRFGLSSMTCRLLGSFLGADYVPLFKSSYLSVVM